MHEQAHVCQWAGEHSVASRKGPLTRGHPYRRASLPMGILTEGLPSQYLRVFVSAVYRRATPSAGLSFLGE